MNDTANVGRGARRRLPGLPIWIGLVAILAADTLAAWTIPTTQAVRFSFAGPADDDNVPAGWHLSDRVGRPSISRFQEGGDTLVSFSCSRCSFSLDKPAEFRVQDAPVIEWRWRARKLPERGDVRERSTDDQALQVIVGFEKRKAVGYVWDSNAPAGHTLTRKYGFGPWGVTLGIVVVRSGAGEVGELVREQRNVLDDYRQIFDADPGAVKGVRVQINSQHTRSVSAGDFGPITFSGAATFDEDRSSGDRAHTPDVDVRGDAKRDRDRGP